MPVDGSDAPAMSDFLVLSSSPRTQTNRGLHERIRMSCGVVPGGRLECLGQQETPSAPISGLGASTMVFSLLTAVGAVGRIVEAVVGDGS